MGDDLIHGDTPCLAQMVEAQGRTGGNLLAVHVPIEEMSLDTRLTAEVEIDAQLSWSETETLRAMDYEQRELFLATLHEAAINTESRMGFAPLFASQYGDAAEAVLRREGVWKD